MKALGATANLALHRHPKLALPPQCHDRRHRLSPHTARRRATPRALYRCRPTVSKGTRRIIDHAKIAPSTIAPAPKSLLPSSCCHRPRQSAHLPPEPPHPQIPIVVNRQPGGPRVPSWEAFGRRPSEPARIAATGRHPKPYTIAAVRSADGCPLISSESGIRQNQRKRPQVSFTLDCTTDPTLRTKVVRRCQHSPSQRLHERRASSAACYSRHRRSGVTALRA